MGICNFPRLYPAPPLEREGGNGKRDGDVKAGGRTKGREGKTKRRVSAIIFVQFKHLLCWLTQHIEA